MYESQYPETPYANVDEGNGRFLIGLLTGAALGAAVGLMFAPKSGNEFRQQLSGSTERLRQKASETYDQASGAVSDLMSKGRQVAERGREAFQSARQGSEQNFPGSTGSTYSGSTGSGTSGM